MMTPERAGAAWMERDCPNDVSWRECRDDDCGLRAPGGRGCLIPATENRGARPSQTGAAEAVARAHQAVRDRFDQDAAERALATWPDAGAWAAKENTHLADDAGS